MSSPQENQAIHCCPQCGAESSVAQLANTQYRCPACDMELAHLDMMPSGSVRRVLGWLKSVNDVIGDRYRVKTVLGRGGFAATYLVEDLNVNGRRRALKEIPECLFDEHELHFLSRIDHPAVPDITDRLKAGGMEYLVLKFGGSRTLENERNRLNGQIPFDDHLRNWMLQLCYALEYLHLLDPPIIHRDLKPANILLDDNDRVMLIDFGIAKESNPSEKTRLSGCAATHGFSSPEQAMDMGTDQRSDIYSFSATLYALLTGLIPPAANDRLLQGKPILPPSQFASNIPPALEKAILRALEINPENRQQTIGELAIVLEGLEPSDSKKISERTVFIDTEPRDAGTARSKLKSVKLPKLHTAGGQPIGSPHTLDSSGQSVTAEPTHYTEMQSTPAGIRKARKKWPIVIGATLSFALAATGVTWYILSSDKAGQEPTVAEKKTDDRPGRVSADMVPPVNKKSIDAVTTPLDALKPTDLQITGQPPPNESRPEQRTTKASGSIKSKEETVVLPTPAVIPTAQKKQPSAVELLRKLSEKADEPPSPPSDSKPVKKRSTTTNKPRKKKNTVASKPRRTTKSRIPKAKPIEEKKPEWTVIWKGSKKTD